MVAGGRHKQDADLGAPRHQLISRVICVPNVSRIASSHAFLRCCCGCHTTLDVDCTTKGSPKSCFTGIGGQQRTVASQWPGHARSSFSFPALLFFHWSKNSNIVLVVIAVGIAASIFFRSAICNIANSKWCIWIERPCGRVFGEGKRGIQQGRNTLQL